MAFCTTGVHLFCQVRYLRSVTWVVEYDHILRVQPHGSTFLVFREKVLHEVYDRYVRVMTLLREECRHASIGFGHEIV